MRNTNKRKRGRVLEKDYSGGLGRDDAIGAGGRKGKEGNDVIIFKVKY